MLVSLAVVTGPAVSQELDKATQAMALSQAKQVGLALRLFAMDNGGFYPQDGVPSELHGPTTANAAFATILPTYTEAESLFGNALSAYQTHPPDNRIDVPYTGKPVKTLEPGENVYAYVLGLDDSSDPGAPIVVDGTNGAGHYVSDPKRRGGVWSGDVAIVVRLDNSASLEKLAGPADARYVPLGKLAETLGGTLDDNLLDVSRFGKKVRLLEPAVPAGK